MAQQEFVPKDMTGVLFREEERRTDKSPDYTGRLTMAGVTYRLAGWVRETRGKKYLSLAVSEQRERQEGASGSSLGDDEVPF